MKAKEMFEELGYEYYDYKFTDEYYQTISLEEDKWKSIEFVKPDKILRLSDDYNFIDIDLKTLSTICQQVKELGWLEE